MVPVHRVVDLTVRADELGNGSPLERELALVKVTVNFDRTDTYHLYFGNETGSPGSLLTFFEWPDAKRGRYGVGGVHHVASMKSAGRMPGGTWRGSAMRRTSLSKTSRPFTISISTRMK